MEDVAKSLGFENEAALTASQAARSSRLAGLERSLDPGLGSERQKLLARQSDKIRETFEQRSAILAGSPDLSINAVATQMQKAVNARVGQLTSIRADNWRGSMALADAASDGQPVIRADNTLKQFHQVLADASDPVHGLSVENLAELRRRVDTLTQKAAAQNGLVTAQDMANLLTNLSTEASGTGALFRDLGTARARMASQSLKRAALDDVAATAAEGSIAAEALTQARLGWARDSQPIDDLRGTAIERLFGKAGFQGRRQGSHGSHQRS
jgi:hypothetical protein